eukprot:3359830-Rhodomonas_salina.1
MLPEHALAPAAAQRLLRVRKNAAQQGAGGRRRGYHFSWYLPDSRSWRDGILIPKSVRACVQRHSRGIMCCIVVAGAPQSERKKVEERRTSGLGLLHLRH